MLLSFDMNALTELSCTVLILVARLISCLQLWLWNAQHDIKIKDYEVEVYAQDTEEDLVAGGVYSVLYDKWLKRPEKKEVELDENKIGKIVGFFEDKIGDIFRKFLSGDRYGLVDKIDDVKDALRKLRKLQGNIMD